MAQVQLPRVDANALAERLRDVDLSRIAELGDELRHLDLAGELRRLDLPGELRRLDLDALKRLDAEGLRTLGAAIERTEADLGRLRASPAMLRIQRLLGREPRKRRAWDALAHPPSLSATVVAGGLIVLAGAAVGGLLAWLYQPGKGDHRRATIRRKLGRALRRVKRSIRPARPA